MRIHDKVNPMLNSSLTQQQQLQQRTMLPRGKLLNPQGKPDATISETYQVHCLLRLLRLRLDWAGCVGLFGQL